MKKIKLIAIIIIWIVLSTIIFLNTNETGKSFLFNDEFLINFSGVIVGIHITLITFIYSCLDSIEKSLKNFFSDNKSAEKANQLLYSSVKELVQNGKLIFICFVIFLLITLITHIDFPFTFPITYDLKLQILLFGKILASIFLIHAIYDSMMAILNLIMVTVSMKINKI